MKCFVSSRIKGYNVARTLLMAMCMHLRSLRIARTVEKEVYEIAIQQLDATENIQLLLR
jgi:hypothetical protein